MDNILGSAAILSQTWIKSNKRGAWEYILQISTVQLKALLNAVCKGVQSMYTFLLGDHLNLLNDSCLQGNNRAKLFLVDVVLEEFLE